MGNSCDPTGQACYGAATSQSDFSGEIFVAPLFAREKKGREVIIQPRFKGCGLLNSCFGDVLIGDTLYEVKIVDRNLRSTDLRQVLIYCALNQYSRQYDIQNVSVVNPRRGVEYRFRLERLTETAAGKTTAELFDEMTGFLFNFQEMNQAQ